MVADVTGEGWMRRPSPAAQPDLFASVDARDEAIARVGANADQLWASRAAAAVRNAARWGTFTTDDVWATLEREGVTTHEPRALGAVMKQLERDGTIRPTGQWVQTRRASAHARPIRVWTGGN
jgi:hypothetical protein